jgi:hypothetical protein
MSISSFDDIILIRFPPGAGGSFLRNLFVAAKYNISEEFELSIHGNSHIRVIPEIDHTFLFDKNIDYDFLISLAKEENKISPFFLITHSLDFSKNLRFFKRIISISYDDDDIPIIRKLCETKWLTDEKKFKDTVYLETYDKVVTISEWRVLYENILSNQKSIWTRSKFTNRAIILEFKDLWSKPSRILFKKLSDFTGIPQENFSRKNLLKWRKVSRSGIQSLAK